MISQSCEEEYVEVVCHHAGAYILAICHYMSPYEGDKHSQHICRALCCTFMAMCWQVSSLRLPQKVQKFEAMFGNQVVVCHYAGATIVIDWHCLDV